MKAILLFLLFTFGASAKTFVPMTEEQEKELRHVVEVIRAAAAETSAKLESAEAKASDAVLQLGAATEALVQAGAETAKVQATLDTRTQERNEALADASVQKKWKLRWFWISVSEGLILVALAYLKLKP